MLSGSGVTFMFDDVAYRPGQRRFGPVCLFAGWAPMGIGWMWPITLGSRYVLIVAGRAMLGAAWKR